MDHGLSGVVFFCHKRSSLKPFLVNDYNLSKEAFSQFDNVA